MKDYEQVMDAYSLHQFMIRKGKAMIDTEEFISFKRIFKNQWDVIHLNIRVFFKFNYRILKNF
jgi:hypothetical protein